MKHFAFSILFVACISAPVAISAQEAETIDLTDAQMEELFANTELADHTLQAIARPNNDTLYTVALIDVTEEPVVLEMPAFDSTYVSLMVTAYDHYVNIPMSTTKGDFDEPATLLFYSIVVNHTKFDLDNALDAGLLAVLEPLGIAPGNAYDSDTALEIDGDALRAVAQRVAAEELAHFGDQDWLDANLVKLFQPKGQIPLETQTFQSVAGPVGQPAGQALYPAILTEDGAPMNALHDYEIVMTAGELPPVYAFWSATLYENEIGFFIPNDRFKFSVGENAGFELDEDGGIRIVIAAEQPDGVSDENWLPINRADMDLEFIMRLYAPDLERHERWTTPVARKLN